MSFPWPCLTDPLPQDSRDQLAAYLHKLLAWHARLQEWPEIPANLPAATPIVSVYSKGTLRGCFGNLEGHTDAIARAFLRAVHDGRFMPITADERSSLSVCLSFVRKPLRCTLSELCELLEPGHHGLALLSERGELSMIHPSMAHEYGLDRDGLLRALANKAGHAVPAGARDVSQLGWHAKDRFFLFETVDVVARREPLSDESAQMTPCKAAARWLTGRIDSDGSVSFAVDLHRNQVERRGLLHHGRVAIALTGLARSNTSSPLQKRAMARLDWDIERSLSGAPVEAWPEAPAQVASTLALARLAGLGVDEPLSAVARSSWLLSNPWEAAQVTTALGNRAPRTLVDAAVQGHIHGAWSPWTVRACIAAGRGEWLPALVDELLHHVRQQTPYFGGVGEAVAETARTAATVEALLELPKSPATGQAIALCRQFLQRWQLRAATQAWLPVEHDGAFPVSPIRAYSQIDTTGHALLALG